LPHNDLPFFSNSVFPLRIAPMREPTNRALMEANGPKLLI
jgi:hypothetical protein